VGQKRATEIELANDRPMHRFFQMLSDDFAEDQLFGKIL
jgi:hypothetical protein